MAFWISICPNEKWMVKFTDLEKGICFIVTSITRYRISENQAFQSWLLDKNLFSIGKPVLPAHLHLLSLPSALALFSWIDYWREDGWIKKKCKQANRNPWILLASEMTLLCPVEHVYPVGEQEKHHVLPSQAKLKNMSHMQRMRHESTHYYFSSPWRHQSGLGPWCAVQTPSTWHLLPAAA